MSASNDSAFYDASTIFENVGTDLPLAVSTNLSKKKIKRTSQDASNIMVQNKKKMKNMLCQSEKPFAQTFSAKKISREVTMTPVHNTDNIISILQKRLPQITFNVVQPKPVLKVPGTPIRIDKFPEKVLTLKPKVIRKKYVSSKKEENNKPCIKITSRSSTPKQKQTKRQNNTPLMNNYTNSNNKDNITKTSSCTKIPPPKIKLQEESTNNVGLLCQVKTTSDNDFNKKTSTIEQEVSKTVPLYFISEYDQFDREISKPLEKTTSQLDNNLTLQSCFEKESFAEQNIYENFDGKILEGDSTNFI